MKNKYTLIIFFHVLLLGSCASHGDNKKADAFNRVIEEQNRVANTSREIVLRELFIKKVTAACGGCR
jgi:hypothetical protein